jgi:hypothetical protein
MHGAGLHNPTLNTYKASVFQIPARALDVSLDVSRAIP